MPAVADCLFCSLAAGDVPATVVREDELTVAFRDLNPRAPTHVLVIPRAHAPDVGTLAATEPDALVAMHLAAAEVARSEGVAESGWRLVFNTGPDAGQSVAHVHGHVLAGRYLAWPPG
jgi:histidine triad (HIT) family protein